MMTSCVAAALPAGSNVADTPQEIQTFQRHIHFLFVQNGCERVCGFTSFAIEELKNIKTFVTTKGTLNTFGFANQVVDRELIDSCLSRMKAIGHQMQASIDLCKYVLPHSRG